MTEEDAMQAAIDAAPLDRLPRLVFCDWLDERNDPRAEGYRVLAEYDRWPHHIGPEDTSAGYDADGTFAFWSATEEWPESVLHDHEWWCAWRARVRVAQGLPAEGMTYHSGTLPYRVGSRREAFDLAALAWSDLKPGHKADCLAELDRVTGRVEADA